MGSVNKVIKNRIFFDIEKENKWLNQLASEGFRLVERSWFSYKFEACSDNTYSYHVEKRSIFEPKENDSYSHFLGELDINLATKQWGWYYFEKCNNGEPFELYTDHASKIKYYIRMFPVLILVALVNISVISSHLTEPAGPWILNISVSYVSNILMLLAIIVASIKYIKRIVDLKKQLNNDEI